MNLAPIVLFVYNRLEHTKQTIKALQKNYLAEESELFIYSDAAKNENAQESVNLIREYIKNLNGFKKITIIEREENFGLAKSIINGVTTIVNKYNKVIVLEDDLVTSPYFLKFMNEALDYYKNNKKVWHISGWNYPIKSNDLDDIFLWRLMNCWGWATWADRWQHYEKDIDKTIAEFNKEDIYKFNIDGSSDFWAQVISNKNGSINTWAIFWYAKIFKNNGFCLNPTETFVENIGHDGSGIHCGEDSSFSSKLSLNDKINFDIKLEENKYALEKIRNFYRSQKKSFLIRVINKLTRIFIGKNIIK